MSRPRSFIVIGFLSGLLAWGIFEAGLFAGSERLFSDRILPEFPADPHIVLIAIDNRSIAELGSWPFPRGRFAELIDQLGPVDPKVLAVDVMFSEPSRLGEADDLKLEQSLEGASFPVVFPIEFETVKFEGGKAVGSDILRPLSRFEAPQLRFGQVNVGVDPDSVVRTVPLAIDNTPAFAAVAAGRESDEVRRIAFAGPRGTIRTVSFVDVLRDPAIRESLTDSYLFVGATAPDLHDEVQTPFSRGAAVSGAELHAQIANMLLHDYKLVFVEGIRALLWLLVAGLLSVVSFAAFKKLRFAVIGALSVGLLLFLFVIYDAQSAYILPVLYSALAWVFAVSGGFMYRYRTLDKEKRVIRETFGKYVSRDILEEMLRNPEKVRLGGEDCEVTVFFSDVRGFTTLSEKLSPSELVHFLNRYLTRMTDIALDAGGVLDKYIGDAIMAFWGAPLKRPTHAVDAARASLKMVDSLIAFNKESREEGGLEIDIGIGLNSGTVVAGNMGSEQRFDYTVMGDTVNLASRLEGQTKTYGIHILVSEAVVRQLTPEFLTREVDRIKVKGKNLPVTVFEIVENSKREQVQKIISEFEAAREAYYSGDWRATVRLANEILSRVDDGPTKVYKQRAEEFLVSPPDHWEGVYKLTSK